MSKANVNVLARQWFGEDMGLVYGVAWKWARRFIGMSGLDYAAARDLEEIVQDGVCRGYAEFAGMATRVRGVERRKRVCVCVIRGVRRAVRGKSRFGNPSTPSAVRADAMNRWTRVRPDGRHGTDQERDYLDVEYVPVTPPAQRWEVEELVVANGIPERYRKTAIYAAMGLSQVESAMLQGVDERTIRNHLKAIRQHLDPMGTLYGIVCWALEVARKDKTCRSATA